MTCFHFRKTPSDFPDLEFPWVGVNKCRLLLEEIAREPCEGLRETVSRELSSKLFCSLWPRPTGGMLSTMTTGIT